MSVSRFAVARCSACSVPWRREDDHIPHALRPARAHPWDPACSRPRPPHRACGGSSAAGLCRAEVRALWRPIGSRKSRFLRERLWAARRHERIAWAVAQFELETFLRQPSGKLPGGYKQRLAMAAALLHEPEILFLDEPTSGADPLARREFWRRITALAEQGVTVIVTTHFMEEAEYCDHIAILDHGQVLAHGTPADIRSYARNEGARNPTMEDAFIAIVEAGRETGTESSAEAELAAALCRRGRRIRSSVIPAALQSAWSCRLC